MNTFVNHYMEQCPDVHFDLDYLHPEEVYERVASNNADLGLVSFPKVRGGDFTSIPWCEQEMAVIIPTNHEFDNIENIKRAVEIGAGVSILPGPTVSREVEIGILKTITIAGERWIQPPGLVHKRHKPLSIAAEKFIELITADQSWIHYRRPKLDSK